MINVKNYNGITPINELTSEEKYAIDTKKRVLKPIKIWKKRQKSYLNS